MSETVAYASDRDPLIAEVICVRCWSALPEWRDVYPYTVPDALEHLTGECAHCGACDD